MKPNRPHEVQRAPRGGFRPILAILTAAGLTLPILKVLSPDQHEAVATVGVQVRAQVRESLPRPHTQDPDSSGHSTPPSSSSHNAVGGDFSPVQEQRSDVTGNPLQHLRQESYQASNQPQNSPQVNSSPNPPPNSTNTALDPSLSERAPETTDEAIDRFLDDILRDLMVRLNTLKGRYIRFPEGFQQAPEADYSHFPQEISDMLTRRVVEKDPQAEIPTIRRHPTQYSAQFLVDYRYLRGQMAKIEQIREQYLQLVAFSGRLFTPALLPRAVSNVAAELDSLRDYHLLPDRGEVLPLFPSYRLAPLRDRMREILQAESVNAAEIVTLLDGIRNTSPSVSDATVLKEILESVIGVFSIPEKIPEPLQRARVIRSLSLLIESFGFEGSSPRRSPTLLTEAEYNQLHVQSVQIGQALDTVRARASILSFIEAMRNENLASISALRNQHYTSLLQLLTSLKNTHDPDFVEYSQAVLRILNGNRDFIRAQDPDSGFRAFLPQLEELITSIQRLG